MISLATPSVPAREVRSRIDSLELRCVWKGGNQIAAARCLEYQSVCPGCPLASESRRALEHLAAEEARLVAARHRDEPSEHVCAWPPCGRTFTQRVLGGTPRTGCSSSCTAHLRRKRKEASRAKSSAAKAANPVAFANSVARRDERRNAMREFVISGGTAADLAARFDVSENAAHLFRSRCRAKGWIL